MAGGEEMSWKQYLTEKVLKKCWHDGRTPFNCGFKCRKCGNTFTINRTYNNRNDMMDLYEAIWKDGKWSKYETFVHIIWMNDDKLLLPTIKEDLLKKKLKDLLKKLKAIKTLMKKPQIS